MGLGKEITSHRIPRLISVWEDFMIEKEGRKEAGRAPVIHGLSFLPKLQPINS